MKALIATNHLEVFSGSEIVCLELAEHLVRAEFRLDAYANCWKPLLERRLADLGAEILHESAMVRPLCYDFVYCQHFIAPLFDYGPHPAERERTTIAFGHLSAHEPMESVGVTFEDALADVVLANSPETAEQLRQMGIREGKLEVFHNAAPQNFWFCRPTLPAHPKNVLFVSNHPPSEILTCAALLRQSGVNAVLLGLKTGRNRRVDPQHLAEFDAVVTIGKTVPYAIASRTPVYVYDHFGGPGYLTAENFEACAERNFSGRCCFRRISADELACEIIEGYGAARIFYGELPEDVLGQFRLEPYLDRVLRLEGSTATEKRQRLFSNPDLVERDRAIARLIQRFSRTERRLRRARDA